MPGCLPCQVLGGHGLALAPQRAPGQHPRTEPRRRLRRDRRREPNALGDPVPRRIRRDPEPALHVRHRTSAPEVGRPVDQRRPRRGLQPVEPGGNPPQRHPARTQVLVLPRVRVEPDVPISDTRSNRRRAARRRRPHERGEHPASRSRPERTDPIHQQRRRVDRIEPERRVLVVVPRALVPGATTLLIEGIPRTPPQVPRRVEQTHRHPAPTGQRVRIPDDRRPLLLGESELLLRLRHTGELLVPVQPRTQTTRQRTQPRTQRGADTRGHQRTQRRTHQRTTRDTRPHVRSLRRGRLLQPAGPTLHTLLERPGTQALRVVLRVLPLHPGQLTIELLRPRQRPASLRLVRLRPHLTRQRDPGQHLIRLLLREPRVPLAQVPLLLAIQPHVTEPEPLRRVVVQHNTRRIRPRPPLAHPLSERLLILLPSRLPERGVERVVRPLHVLPGQCRPRHLLEPRTPTTERPLRLRARRLSSLRLRCPHRRRGRSAVGPPRVLCHNRSSARHVEPPQPRLRQDSGYTRILAVPTLSHASHARQSHPSTELHQTTSNDAIRHRPSPNGTTRGDLLTTSTKGAQTTHPSPQHGSHLRNRENFSGHYER